eukprot:TRINITY_DN23548_c0_g1_i1.p1 TRINITY_DN23548_c0_g1~~TRINITY_DN23548_c0_g1_i1.p1  ORF type:complete len:145 (+),score=14.75 TRINITY_DN23548_c0_g1_i1:433-867(+)
MQILWTILAIYTFLKESRKAGQRNCPNDLLIQGFDLGKSLYEKSIKKLVRMMSARPAEILGLRGIKGTIKEGADADLVIFDPFSFFDVSLSDILSKHPATYLFDRQKFCGQVVDVYLRGVKIIESKRVLQVQRGQILKRSFISP